MFHVKKIKAFELAAVVFCAVVGIGSVWIVLYFAREIWLIINFLLQTFILSFFCSVLALILESDERKRKRKKKHNNFNTYKNEQINKYTFDRNLEFCGEKLEKTDIPR